jgi:hypothetical protein
MAQVPVAALRKFVKTRVAEERCDVCGIGLPADHIHQFDPVTRRVRCACQSCAIASTASYLEIPRRVRVLTDFRMSDAQWDDLLIPIALAFFSYSTPARRVVALYPGPAGAAESLLKLPAWDEIVVQNRELRDMQPDVEALLVNRVGSTREYLLAPIDECYKLVGIIRLHWRGFSGGSTVWGEIASFFDALRQKENSCPA